MRRRSIAAAIAGALLLALALAPTAAAQLPNCGYGLFDFGPPSHAHAGKPFAIPYHAYSPENIHDVVVTVDGVPHPVRFVSDGRLTFDAPTRVGRFTVSVSWRETQFLEDDPPECADRWEYTVHSVPPRAKIGTDTTRVDGRWRVRMTPRNKNFGSPANLSWRIRPTCDFGACTVAVSGDLGPLRAVPNDTMEYVAAGARIRADCGDGGRGTIKNAYSVSLEYRFSVEKSVELESAVVERATRIRGTVKARYVPTRAARATGCRPITATWSLRGVRE